MLALSAELVQLCPHPAILLRHLRVGGLPLRGGLARRLAALAFKGKLAADLLEANPRPQPNDDRERYQLPYACFAPSPQCSLRNRFNRSRRLCIDSAATARFLSAAAQASSSRG